MGKKIVHTSKTYQWKMSSPFYFVDGKTHKNHHFLAAFYFPLMGNKIMSNKVLKFVYEICAHNEMNSERWTWSMSMIPLG